MSVARHHNEWLSLVEVSGPFLSLPVLMRVFPQQLDTLDAGTSRDVRLAFSEWEDAEGDRAIHTAWLEFVLNRVLGFPNDVLLQGQGIPTGLEVRVAEHGEDLRPTYAIKRAEDAVPSLLVVTYPAGQQLERVVSDARWPTASPATRMMTLLLGTGVPLGLVTNGADWQLVAARPGETTTYVTWDATLWSEEPLTLRAFTALLGVKRVFGVQEPERLPALLAESAQNQQEVTDQLGHQVRKAVEVLVQAVDRINQDEQGRLLSGVGEKQLYESALTVMMRLVFVFTAEERGLLLMGDPLWDRHYSISSLRDQLREVPDENLLTYRHDAWSRLLSTFRAIYGGVEHDQMRLPAYGGALFDPDRFPFLEGRQSGTSWRDAPSRPLPINNRTVLHLLEALQFLEMRLPGGGGTEPRRLSFRALDIEQIGHVYEGLLDHTAKRAGSMVLGLRGSSGEDVELELAFLEGKASEGEPKLVEVLKEKTGRQAPAIRRDLNRGEPPSPLTLQAVCAGHAGLYDRLVPFSHLLRDDSAGQPVVIFAGSIYVTKGSDRRSTGTHYTQRSLTEPMVKTTLDPLLYAGVSEGVEPTPETLKSPTEILALKVCDLACGSGAFLVQACRYMAERLVEAWSRVESLSTDGVALTVPEAIPAGANHSLQLLPSDPEERLALARRLVAERCIYGVDINPMAVEMAKLSLWLITLHKHRPFTFLDHAIKCGDTLLGLHDAAQLEQFHLVPVRSQARVTDYIRHEVRRLLASARAKREELERFTALDVRDAELKARLHREAEESLLPVRLMADLVVGAGLSTVTSNADRSLTQLDARLEELVLDLGSVLSPQADERLAAEPQRAQELWPLRRKAEALLRTVNAGCASSVRRPFHWLVEFPEVFLTSEGAGFDALLGNPPFVGGQKITGLFGTNYRDYLVSYLADGRRGSADLCAYFFLRAASVVRNSGYFGLLAVNTIAEGDTRQVGLEAMLRLGVSIHAARPNFEWPGAAAVSASAVHLRRGDWGGVRRLSGEVVPTISAFLSAEDEWSPKPLAANSGKSFQGSIVLGMGFTLTPVDGAKFIEQDARNAEVLFPFLNGEDLNSHPGLQASRWVINFWDWPLERSAEGSWLAADAPQRDLWFRDGRVPPDYPGRVALDYPAVLDVVDRMVRPERQRRNEQGDFVLRRPLPDRWWHYAEKRPALYHAIGRGGSFFRHPEGWQPSSKFGQVLACAEVTKYLAFAFIPNETVFSDRVDIFVVQSNGVFAVLQSSVHDAWARRYSARLETRLKYSIGNAFETFPFPPLPHEMEELGRELYQTRSLALDSLQVGLTGFYNRLHDASCTHDTVVKYREILCKVDELAVAAYGWRDMNLGHGFHNVASLPPNDQVRFTVSEAARLELLRRLAVLNRQRWREEQAQAQSLEAAIADAPPTGAPRRRRGPRLSVVSTTPDMFDVPQG